MHACAAGLIPEWKQDVDRIGLFVIDSDHDSLPRATNSGQSGLRQREILLSTTPKSQRMYCRI